MQSNDAQAFGPALRLLRTRRRLRQYQVADRAGLTKAMLSSYEVAGVKPSLQSLTAVLGALESDLSEFQLALDVITGRVGPEEWRKQDAVEDSPPEGTDKVLEILVPRLGGILPLLERIAQALEGVSRPGVAEPAPPGRTGLRQAGGSRPHPRPE